MGDNNNRQTVKVKDHIKYVKSASFCEPGREQEYCSIMNNRQNRLRFTPTITPGYIKIIRKDGSPFKETPDTTEKGAPGFFEDETV